MRLLVRMSAPTHASFVLGIFLCASCGECHRQLPGAGVRSLMYDAWDSASVDVMAATGNLKSNARFEATLHVRDRVLPDADGATRATFIAAKYAQRAWYGEPSVAPLVESSPDPSSSPIAAAAASSPVEPSSEVALGRAAKRRLRLATAPKMCPLEALELEMQRNKELRAERHNFDPAAARRVTEALHAAACSEPLPPLNDALSLVLTTSAIPSNPSLELIEGVLSSCEANLGLDSSRQLRRCVVYITMDGYMLDATLAVGTKPKFKNGRLDEVSIAAYESFKVALRCHIAAQPYPHLFLIGLELPFRHGFAGALHESLQFVSTPYMLVMQHDWCFIRPIHHSIWQLVDLLEREKDCADDMQDGESEAAPVSPLAESTEQPSEAAPSPASADSHVSQTGRLPINYVVFQASTTHRYLEKDYHGVRKHLGPIFRLHDYPVVEGDDTNYSSTHAAESTAATAASSPSPALPGSSSPMTLCPVAFWFDRNHLVRTSFYRKRVFGAYRFMRSAAFLEDTFGQIQLNMIRNTSHLHAAKQFAPKPFAYFGSFLYHTDADTPHVDHVHGRKFITPEQRAQQYARDAATEAKVAERAQARAQQALAAEQEEDEVALDELYVDAPDCPLPSSSHRQ